MDQRERANDYEESIRASLDALRSRLWTALPGIIQSYDPAKLTAVVQPSIQARAVRPDGTTVNLTLPLLLDCPVTFPSGGGVILTMPVKPGDECLVIFASRCIDAWWQSGGVQPQAEARMHDLSDGFVIVGPRSIPNVPGAVSDSVASLRSVTGETRVELDPAAHTVNITAPGGSTLAANVTINGTLHVTGTATFDGDLNVGGVTNLGGGGATPVKTVAGNATKVTAV